MIPLLVACAAPLPEPPSAIELRAVEVELPGQWTGRAATATVEGDRAETTTVQLGRAGEPAIDVVAARSEWDLRARRVRFDGDVTVRRGDITLTCATLEVSYLDADTLDRLAASGGVHVARGARTADAAQATLEARTGELVLTGSPTLTDGPNRLVGERIVMHLDDETASCDGGPSGPCRLVIAGEALPVRGPR